MPLPFTRGTISAIAYGLFGGPSAVTASYLVVAGGGSTGTTNTSYAGGGGGGAGGLLTGTTSLSLATSYTVIVGAGGAAVSGAGTNGLQGSNSQFGTLTASVGGGGGSNTNPTSAANGGSGGGSAFGYTVGTGTSGQGNSGGLGSTSSPYYGGGGGGGAGAAGSAGTSTAGGNGGVGLTSSISGTSTYYAGGGGGGTGFNGGASGSGGNGGGGAAGSAAGGVGNPGTANTGGGAGSPSGSGAYGGANGGSGIVIISYTGPQKFGGGVVTTSGTNVIHTFTTSGTLSPLSSLTANFLVIAGGGSGSQSGGGAGGFRTSTGTSGGGGSAETALTIDTNSNYIVVVGAGGAAVTGSNITGNNGSNSSFFSITSTGGGTGGSSGTTGNSGGSGGGAGYTSSTSISGGAGTANQGYAGGNASAPPSGDYVTGGGGGASSVGGSSSGNTSGSGGSGLANSISGTSTTYAGGGGGGARTPQGTSPGSGGSGGGGAGSGTGNGTNATANTGSGGGGACIGNGGNPATNTSGAGGSGIVIISYPGSVQQMAGGTVTISGGNVIHTFTTSGYLTPLKYVGNSLRFRSSASAYLSRTFGTPTNQKIWTYSFWFKRGTLGADQLFIGQNTGTNQWYFRLDGGGVGVANTLLIGDYYNTVLTTAPLYRDPAAWYHIVLAYDTTQATATNRVKLYVNGVQQSYTQGASFPAQNSNPPVNQSGLVNNISGSLGYIDGYMTEINFIDGQQLTPNAFGTSNSYGVWQPITYGGSYGTNGFYLPFTGSSSYYGTFNGSSQYLTVANNSALQFGTGDFTVEFWVNQAALTSYQTAYSLGYVSTGDFILQTGNGTGNWTAAVTGSPVVTETGSTVVAGAWYHIAVVRSGSTMSIYRNGIKVASASTTANINSATALNVGYGTVGNTYPLNGYMSNLRVVKGTAVYTGNFTPSTTPLTAISGTSLLTLQNATIVDNSTNAFSITNTGSVTTSQAYPFTMLAGQSKDYSPQGNNWTNNNIGVLSGSTLDVMTDVPTLTSTTVANYAVLNPLLTAGGAGQTFTNGNLTVTDTGGNGFGSSSIAVSSGKYYCEVTYAVSGSSCTIGIWQLPFNSSGTFYTANANYRWYNLNGVVYNASGGTGNTYATYTVGDVIGMALDMDTGTITFYKNGTAQSSAITGLTGTWMFGINGGGGGASLSANFGQQPFKYTVPSGFVALNTYNL